MKPYQYLFTEIKSNWYKNAQLNNKKKQNNNKTTPPQGEGSAAPVGSTRPGSYKLKFGTKYLPVPMIWQAGVLTVSPREGGVRLGYTQKGGCNPLSLFHKL